MTPSPLALSIVHGVEHRAVERALQGLPTESLTELAVYIDEELATLRARLDTLETTTRNAVILWNHGMTVEAHRLVEQALEELD